MSRYAAIVLLPLSLAGCHLVDQRDFDSHAGLPPARAPIVAHLVSTPSLVTIIYTTPDPSYRTALTGAVRKALAIKPDVLFTVTTRVPPGADPQPAVLSGQEVAQAIVDAGAHPGQVQQLFRFDPAVTVKEVTVTVE